MIKNILTSLALIFLTLVACTKLAEKYSWDITQNNSNSLSKVSQQLLDSLDAEMTLTVYSPQIRVLNICETTLARYQQYTPKIKIALQQTVLDAEQAGKLKLYTDHNLVVSYKNVQQAMDLRADELNEKHFSMLIQKTINFTNNWLVFLTGHQEADPLDTGEFGLSSFAAMFANQGMHVTTLNLAQQQFIPQNTALLVVANPQQDFLPIEKAQLHQYLSNGGKLLWFTEPDAPITAFIAEEFGIKPSKGVAIDPDSQRLGSPHPALKIVGTYPDHAINKGLTAATIMPWSAHLQILYQANDWDQNVFLSTAAYTWTYNGTSTTDLNILSRFKEHTGPLNLGIALTRKNPNTATEQRAMILGDSSFMINKYLPLYANAQLVNNILAWTHNDTHAFVFATAPLKDLSYNPSKPERILQQYVFTIMLPLFLVAIGYVIGRQDWPLNLPRGWLKGRFRLKI